MEQVDLTVEKRTETGTVVAQRLRKAGLIPANLHGINKNGAQSLSLSSSEFFRATHTKAGEHVIFNLRYKDSKTNEPAIAKEVQYDPLKGFIRHVDFQSISLTEKIFVPVPVRLTGQAIGVKEGGVLGHLVHEIEVEALPLDVPEHIELNIAALKIGDAIHLRDITLGEKIKILGNPEETVVAVSRQAAAEVVAPVAAVAGEKSVEPEVIRKSKEKAEEE